MLIVSDLTSHFLPPLIMIYSSCSWYFPSGRVSTPLAVFFPLENKKKPSSSCEYFIVCLSWSPNLHYSFPFSHQIIQLFISWNLLLLYIESLLWKCQLSSFYSFYVFPNWLILHKLSNGLVEFIVILHVEFILIWFKYCSPLSLNLWDLLTRASKAERRWLQVMYLFLDLTLPYCISVCLCNFAQFWS